MDNDVPSLRADLLAAWAALEAADHERERLDAEARVLAIIDRLADAVARQAA